MVATGKSAKALSLTIRSAFATTGIGIGGMIGLGILIEQLITLRSKMDEVKAAARLLQPLHSIYDRQAGCMNRNQAQQDVDILRNLRERTKGKGARKIEATKQEQEQLLKDQGNSCQICQRSGIFEGKLQNKALALAKRRSTQRWVSPRKTNIGLDQEISGGKERMQLQRRLLRQSLKRSALMAVVMKMAAAQSFFRSRVTHQKGNSLPSRKNWRWERKASIN